MAYHVLGTNEVLFETETLDQAKAIRQYIRGAEKIIEGPVAFLRLQAKKKFGQHHRDYPSNVDEDADYKIVA